jgi:hypothetical protein
MEMKEHPKNRRGLRSPARARLGRLTALALVTCMTATIGVSAADGAGAGVCGKESGNWTATAKAAVALRVAQSTGLHFHGCTGSAWVVGTKRAEYYVWAVQRMRGATRGEPYHAVAFSTPLTQTDGIRVVWNVRRLVYWMSAGPSATDRLPGETLLARIERASIQLTPR